MDAQPHILISGGGTGGHVFPAIAIANALYQRNPQAKFLFVGAEGRMEMEKVPEAGYPIRALPVQGFPRRVSFRSIGFFWKLLLSLIKARRIVRTFAPDVVVGVGGFASGPVGRVAAKNNIPLLLQEQNSYAGVTNRLLAKHASKICVAYDDMERWFPADKIIKTGNPVRNDLIDLQIDKKEAAAFFGMQLTFAKVVLVVGGSGGARQINESILQNMQRIEDNPRVAFIWQTGKYYYSEAYEAARKQAMPNLFVFDFISRMDYAYGLADLVISRAGAGTIAELGAAQKPAVLVPSPNVAEDHQTKNAMALVDKGAAVLVKDNDAPEELIIKALEIVKDNSKLQAMAERIRHFGMRNAAETIAKEVEQLIFKPKH